ncbi:major facilitator superfamily MFS_1 [Coriobacterium glomerans PW2]|uniref:Tetracycline resistance protein n=1 Tax=Coriobacterium glomerans (strain ATCC 49209 / DSM 20642 / JCM 10262 / PW2) TaxID=700015 RepID=F2NAN5_CORGP|nr:MFS transporter [Coriobacterium glomerans]AEB07491.1 major facilitator superfamily MFS_1 [Coriobacterium glomerans PW2]
MAELVAVERVGDDLFEENRLKTKKALPALLIVFLLGTLMTQAFNLVFQNIGDTLGMSGSAALLSTLPGIVLGVVCMLYGTLCDFISPKHMTLFGVSSLIAGSLLGFFGSFNFWIALVARMIQTAGGQVAGSVFLVMSVKYLTDKEKAIYIGIYNAVYYLAAAVGIFAGGIITSIDWKYLFLVPGISLIFIPSLIKYTPDISAEGERIDGIGITIFAVLAGLIAVYFSFPSLTLIIAAISVAAILIVWILKAGHPFLSRSFVTNAAYMSVVLMVFMICFFNFACVPIYNALGDALYSVPLTEVSSWLTAVYIFAAIVGVGSGPAINALGRSKTLVLAASLMIIGFGGSALLLSKGFVVLSVLACLFVGGMTIAYTPLYDTASDALPKEEGGRGIGILDLMLNTASSIGMAVYSSLIINKHLSAYSPIGASAGEPALISNIFLIMSAVSALSLIVFLVFRKVTLKHLL